MKKTILTTGIAVLFIFGSATFMSCGNAEESHDAAEMTEEHAQEEVVETAYYCPMKCEGDKTYAVEGACPTCGMDLVEVE